jgi:hypothetical protein
MIRAQFSTYGYLGKQTLTALAVLCWLAACAPQAGPSKTSSSPFSKYIRSLMQCAADGTSPQQCSAVPQSLMRIDPAGRVQVDVRYTCDTTPPPLEPAKAAGLDITLHVSAGPYCTIEGWIFPSALSKLAGIKDILMISLPTYAHYGA